MLSELMKRSYFGLNIASITIIGLLLKMLSFGKVPITFNFLLAVSVSDFDDYFWFYHPVPKTGLTCYGL